LFTAGLALIVAVCLTSQDVDAARLDLSGDTTVWGVLRAAGLLFFAFAGYARIATLGEEVRDPARTIPRAIPLALAATLIIYATVTAAVLMVLARRDWPAPPRRWPKPYARPACRAWPPSYALARHSQRSARCWR
jgi:APA family basic amino acid/polyamine antiporter